MDDLICETAPAFLDIVNRRAKCFIKDISLAVTLRSHPLEYELELQDISGAMKAGATCASFRIVFKNSTPHGSEGLSMAFDFVRGYSNRFDRILADLRALNWVSEGLGFFPSLSFAGLTVYRRDAQGVRTFSPFATLNRLKEMPKKWALAHVVRCLWNGQFKDLRCEGRYSDDYLHDAATNFHIGNIADSKAFARRLIEHPHGWWVQCEGTYVGISQCQFNYNGFTVVLEGGSRASERLGAEPNACACS